MEKPLGKRKTAKNEIKVTVHLSNIRKLLIFFEKLLENISFKVSYYRYIKQFAGDLQIVKIT